MTSVQAEVFSWILDSGDKGSFGVLERGWWSCMQICLNWITYKQSKHNYLIQVQTSALFRAMECQSTTEKSPAYCVKDSSVASISDDFIEIRQQGCRNMLFIKTDQVRVSQSWSLSTNVLLQRDMFCLPCKTLNHSILCLTNRPIIITLCGLLWGQLLINVTSLHLIESQPFMKLYSHFV